ncbi:MAG: prepilin-type N-terminal cleavage/methylation domain-containing protein [Clostridiales bacterium]|nr:prepilin-type N-terminal cleavage/methylation domain-containing protein [Clostridiales bacterium]
MKKLDKNKNGFTLMEMVLVIAIILIISGALAYGIVAYINFANSRADEVASHDAKANQAHSAVDKLLTSNPAMPAGT